MQAALGEDEATVADETEFLPVHFLVQHHRAFDQVAPGDAGILREQSQDGAVEAVAVVQEKWFRLARPAIDVNTWLLTDREGSAPLPPVAFIETADAASEQFGLVFVEVLDA